LHFTVPGIVDIGPGQSWQGSAERWLEFNQKTHIKIRSFANAKFTFDIYGLSLRRFFVIVIVL
jgi:hypothetical protein